MAITNQLLTSIENYLRGTPSEVDLQIINAWYDQHDDAAINLPLNQADFLLLQEKLRENALLRIQSDENQRKGTYLSKISGLWWAAAIVLLTVGVWAGLKINNNISVQEKAGTALLTGEQGDIEHLNTEKAHLTLSDGTVITLDSVQNGAIPVGGLANVIKLDAGTLAFKHSINAQDNIIKFNTLTTTHGGQYQIVLPDGTKVWLNSVSQLTFPTSFRQNERRVQLKGEAYFEVMENKNSPFFVDMESGAVQVLGTEFNLQAYSDEEAHSATVVNGAIKLILKNELMVKDSRTLKAADQVIIRNDGVTYQSNVNIKEATAWKSGQFHFNNASIEQIMREAARWYNIDVSYEGTTSERFNGSLPRTVTASTFFNVFESTGSVKFEINNKKVKVHLLK